jgi:hypothetical protein
MTNVSEKQKLKKPSPIELHVIRASDFICFDAEKHLNFEASKKVLQELALACRKRGLDRAMVDLRELPVPEKPRFTDAELVELAGAFHDAGFTRRQRLAILHRHDVHGTIRKFTSIGRKGGLQVHAFLEYDEAIHWLGKTIEELAEQKQGASVPILRKKRKDNAQAAHSHVHSAAGAGATLTPMRKPVSKPRRKLRYQHKHWKGARATRGRSSVLSQHPGRRGIKRAR